MGTRRHRWLAVILSSLVLAACTPDAPAQPTTVAPLPKVTHPLADVPQDRDPHAHDAIKIFREVVEFDRRQGLRRSEALNHRRLGQALIDAGQLDEAIIEFVCRPRPGCGAPRSDRRSDDHGLARGGTQPRRTELGG